MKTILFATDGSELATHALEHAVEIARDMNAKLEVLIVTVDTPLTRVGILPSESPESAERIAHAAAAVARACGVQAHTTVTFGKPADEIARRARKLDVDLVVVGSHGHGALRGAVMGSVSNALLSHCPAPVMIVGQRDRTRVAA